MLPSLLPTLEEWARVAGAVVVLAAALTVLGKWRTGSWRLVLDILRILATPARVDRMETELMELQTTTRRTNEMLASITVRTTDKAIILVGANGIVEDASEAAERLLGYPRGGLVGRVHDTLVPGEVRAQHDDWMEHYYANPVPKRMASRRVEILRLDGDRTSVWVGLEPIVGAVSENGRVAVLVYLDTIDVPRSSQGG